MKNVKGFTLIEILLVVSIIGLMSSVVLSSVNTAREKARIATLKQSSSSFKHTFGNSILAEWNFDLSGEDLSGNNINMSLKKGAGYVNEGVFKESVKLLGGTDYATISANPNLVIEEEGAIELMVYVDEVSGNGGIINFQNSVTSGRPMIRTYKAGGKPAFGVTWYGAEFYTGEQYPAPFTTTMFLELDKWHHIIFSWTTDYFWVYLDGELVNEGPFTPGIGSQTGGSPPYPWVEIGRYGTNNFTGYVDNVRIYNKSLFEN